MDAVGWFVWGSTPRPAIERSPLDPVLANRASFFKTTTLSLEVMQTRGFFVTNDVGLLRVGADRVYKCPNIGLDIVAFLQGLKQRASEDTSAQESGAILEG